VVQILRLWIEPAIMLDMLDERALQATMLAIFNKQAIMFAMLDEQAKREISIFLVYRK